MTAPSPPAARAEVLARVADQVPMAGRPLLVAVDGVDGSGKSWFADELAGVLRSRGRVVVRACLDDFHHSRAHRHGAGRTSETVWTRHFDYRALRRELLGPWLEGTGAPYRPSWHDLDSDTVTDAPVAEVPADGVLLFDGVFSQREELANAWDLVVFLDVAFETSVARLAARDGGSPDPEHPDQQRYVGAQQIYFRTCAPHASADVVIDNSDLDRPRIISGTPAPAADAAPRGWAVDGDQITRTVRLPRAATDRARIIDGLAEG